MRTSYRGEIAYQRGGRFEQKVPTFGSETDGLLYVEDLADRSSMIADYRVVAVQADATHVFIGGKVKCLAVLE